MVRAVTTGMEKRRGQVWHPPPRGQTPMKGSRRPGGAQATQLTQFVSVAGPGGLLHVRIFVGGKRAPKSQANGVEDLKKLAISGCSFHPEELEAGVPRLRALMEALRKWQEVCVADDYGKVLSLLSLRANMKGKAASLLLKAKGNLETAVSLLLAMFAPMSNSASQG